MTHTPGPWHVDHNGLSGYGDNGNTFNIRTAPGVAGEDLIAALPSSFRLLDCDSTDDPAYIAEAANAHLIAAAPELLEMAEAFESYLQDDSRSERRRQACLSAARAAIAKARGK